MARGTPARGTQAPNLWRHGLECGATRAYTLVEVVLVVGLLVVISSLAVPRFIEQLEREELPGSARQFRSLITMARANAAYDGKRYRIRFPSEDELKNGADVRQPIVEREADPVREPEIYTPVPGSWAAGETLLGNVRCAEVRAGRPTIEKLQDLRLRGTDEIAEELIREQENLEAERLPLYIEPDGASEWATFVLTRAPEGIPPDEVLDYPTLELIVEGNTGFTWIQRPFYDEELDLFEEKGWPAVLRQDFTDPRVLTEDDVLELRDVNLPPEEAPTP